MIKFRQQVEVRCSEKGCPATQAVTGYFSIGADNIVKLLRFMPSKKSGWRAGRFVPGVLTNREARLVICCPEHVKKHEEQENEEASAPQDHGPGDAEASGCRR